MGEKRVDNFKPGETYIPPSGKVIDQDDISAMHRAVDDVAITEGKYCADFSKGILDSLQRQVRFASLCNSGSSANLLAVSAICQPEFGSKRAKEGDEVITTAVGFPTTLSPILQNGLTPVFVDVNFPTYTPSVDDIEEKINRNTKAIVLAHPLGNPVEVEKIADLAREYGIFFIGDCCDAFGSTYKSKPVESFSDISTLSFFPAHMIAVGEGGAVLSSSPLIDKVVKSIRDWGRDCWCIPGVDNTCGKRFSRSYEQLPYGYDHKYVYQRIGYNLKMADLQGALGASQVKKLSKFNEQRRENWQYLRDEFGAWSDYFILPEHTPYSKPAWFGFCLTLKKGVPFNRLELVTYLESRKIGTRQLFGGNLLRQPAFKHLAVDGKFYNSDAIMEHTFWIGCWHGLGRSELEYVVSVFDAFIKSKKGMKKK